MRLPINRIGDRNILHYIMNTLYWNLIRGRVRLVSVRLPVNMLHCIILYCIMSGESVRMYYNILYCIILYCIISGEGVSLYFIISEEGVSLYCIMSGEVIRLYCIMSGEGVSLNCTMSGEIVCLPFNILPWNTICGRVGLTINVLVKMQSLKVSTVMT